jgi:hypothetical protein
LSHDTNVRSDFRSREEFFLVYQDRHLLVPLWVCCSCCLCLTTVNAIVSLFASQQGEPRRS